MASASASSPPPLEAPESYEISDDSDIGDLFGDRFVTQSTQPLTHPGQLFRQSTPPRFTQTQRPSSPPIVQVQASSPTQHLTPGRPVVGPVNGSSPFQSQSLARGVLNGGLYASQFAPPGTRFQTPAYPAYSQSQSQPQSQRGGARSQTLEFSQDVGSGRVSDSSDDELGPSADIVPSMLKMNGRPLTAPMKSGDATREQFQTFMYRGPATVPQKRSADVMADAYASSSRMPKQSRPLPAAALKVRPAAPQPKLEDIDYNLQNPVRQIMEFSGCTVSEGMAAYFRCHKNINDASAYMLEEKEKQASAIDLTSSDREKEIEKPPVRSFKAPGTKSTVKRDAATNKTIAQKWSTTQTRPDVMKYLPDDFEELPRPISRPPAALQSSSPPRPLTPPKPIRRRLVQGRKAPSSPVESPVQVLPQAPAPPAQTVRSGPARKKIVESEDEAIELDDDDSDESEVEVQSDVDEGLGQKLLKFLNTCSKLDLIDVSSQPVETVDLVMSQRPFASLDAVRAVCMEYTTTRGGKSTVRKKEVGDKLVDICLEMYQGYEAVDELVTKCEDLGKPIAEELKQWGLNAFGVSSQNGELSMVDIPEAAHDSGIGTPSSSVGDTDEVKTSSKSKLLQQPAVMSKDLVMKDYQVVGLNWLSLLFSKKLSCILADDMGLGKTCQVIAFLSHLYERGVKGPHLIVVPGSTLENWLREFHNFCPTLNVEPYYGSLTERAHQRLSLEENIDKGNVNAIITTYSIAQKEKDAHFLRHLNFVACVYDEGHVLKNSESQRYKELMRIPAQFRLLLTGTPLQNNLQELVSLLAFIMPDLFRDRHEDLQYIFKQKAKTTDEHASLLSAQRISRARSIMTPFILRRKKHQVLKHLPTKTCLVERCEISESQNAIYAAELEKVKAILHERQQAQKDHKTKKPYIATKSANVLMDLRKAAIHPLLFRRHYTDDILWEMTKEWCADPVHSDRTPELVQEDMTVMTDFELNYFCGEYPHLLSDYTLAGLAASGKIAVPTTTSMISDTDTSSSTGFTPFLHSSGKVMSLLRLLRSHIANGHRTLVFSQFTTVLNILEAVLEDASIPYSRLDGTTPMATRQDLIDQFYADTSIPVFMLSTKAGGAGINLACADRVVVFDMGFNPQEDVQAENRAHRVGQTREVEVVRLVSKGTVEEQIHRLGEMKLALDERVAGEGAGAGASTGGGVGLSIRAKDGNIAAGEDEAVAEKQGMEMVEGMLLEQLHDGDHDSGKPGVEESVKTEEQDKEVLSSVSQMSTAKPDSEANTTRPRDPSVKHDLFLTDQQESSTAAPPTSTRNTRSRPTTRPSTPTQSQTSTSTSRTGRSTRNSAATGAAVDAKDAYLDGLKAAGLDMSAA